ncbi:hypothetical protein BpHYR1_031982 [Brachionus plicatilis]|uniref:Uncharacterized protein n=1 Tax=Brachionus plicatilis TaxID=10195 RepID=A0A3M7QEU6_BRAPC|nr:hypothetical protein BpHYR1_031982 [Brachionus plicatilis]
MGLDNLQKTQKAYSEETLQIAIADIEAKKLNKHQASVRFNIPYNQQIKRKRQQKKTRIKRKYGEILTENQVTIISDEEDEEESEIELSPLNDQKSCFKCKTSKQIKTNGFLVRNVTIGLVGNAFQEALI